MDVRELRSFVTVAEQLHFGRAAASLHLSQPALSKQIKALEAQIGGPLFVRNRRDVSLTAAGNTLYPEARRLVRDFQAAFELAQSAVHGEAGKLRIGAGISTIHHFVPLALRRFRDAHPQVQVQIGDMSTPRQLEELLSGQIDVGFVRLPVERTSISVRKVLSERIILAVSSDFPGRPTLRALRDHPFVLIERETSTTYYDHCLRLCGHAGFSPRIAQETRDTFTLLNLVRAGLGVSMVPNSAREMQVKGVKFVPIHDPDARWDVGIAWNHMRRSPLTERFVQVCLQREAADPAVEAHRRGA